jgi:transposase-like protein
MPIEVIEADVTDVYCPYCKTFYGYMTPTDWGFYDSKETQRTCNKCNKPFIVKIV